MLAGPRYMNAMETLLAFPESTVVVEANLAGQKSIKVMEALLAGPDTTVLMNALIL